MATDKVTEPLLTTTDIEKSAISKLNKIIIPISYIITVFAAIDRSNLNYAANQFCSSINISYSEYGTGASLFYITLILFSIPNSTMIEIFSAPYWLGFLSIFWGLSAAITAFVKNKIQYYIIRMLLGVAEAGIFPSLFHYVSCMYPDKYSTYVYGLIVSGVLLAAPISAPMAAALLSMDDLLGFEGWQWLFIVEGLIPVLFSIVVFLRLPKNIDCAKNLNFEEKRYLQNLTAFENDDGDGMSNEMSHKKRFWEAILEIIKIRDFWIVAVATLILFWAFNTIQYFLTLIISSMLSDTESVVDSETCSSTDLSIAPTLLTAIPYFFLNSISSNWKIHNLC